MNNFSKINSNNHKLNNKNKIKNKKIINTSVL